MNKNSWRYSRNASFKKRRSVTTSAALFPQYMFILPSATLITGACPELSKAGTAKIPHKPKKDAVIL